MGNHERQAVQATCSLQHSRHAQVMETNSILTLSLLSNPQQNSNTRSAPRQLQSDPVRVHEHQCLQLLDNRGHCSSKIRTSTGLLRPCQCFLAIPETQHVRLRALAQTNHCLRYSCTVQAAEHAFQAAAQLPSDTRGRQRPSCGAVEQVGKRSAAQA